MKAFQYRVDENIEIAKLRAMIGDVDADSKPPVHLGRGGGSHSAFLDIRNDFSV